MIERLATPRLACLGVAVTLLQMHGGAAQAQELNPSDAPESAGNRPQPGYDPLGIRVGGATVYPSIALTSAYDSNVLAASTDAQSDLALTLTPAIRVNAEHPNRTLGLNAYARLRRYTELHRQNDEQYFASALARQNIGSSGTVEANASWSLTSPSRGTYENSLQNGDPLRETRLTAKTAGTYRFNRLKLRAQVTGEKFNYDDVTLDDGTVIDQTYRNGYRIGGSLEAYYALGSRFSLVVQGAVNEFDYKDKDPARNRDARGTWITAGGLYEVTSLFNVQLGIGHRKHDFDNPLFEDISGLAVNGKLRWYPTPLVSVRLDLEQATETSSYDLVSAVNVSSAVLQTDYELRRNNVVTARLEYSHENYGGIDTNSNFMSASLQSNWKLNRWMRVTGSLAYDRRTSADRLAIPEFDAFRGTLGVTLSR